MRSGNEGAKGLDWHKAASHSLARRMRDDYETRQKVS